MPSFYMNKRNKIIFNYNKNNNNNNNNYKIMLLVVNKDNFNLEKALKIKLDYQ